MFLAKTVTSRTILAYMSLAIALLLIAVLSPRLTIPAANSTGKEILVNITGNADNNIVSLEGKMEFYWSRLLTPVDFTGNDPDSPEKTYLNFPDTWNKQMLNGGKLTGRGHATYRTHLNFDTICPMSVKISDYCNSYKLWINGELVSSGGKPGASKDETVPVKVNTVADFIPLKGANELVIQTANYHEKFGGFRQSFLIGPSSEIKNRVAKRQVADAFILGILVLTIIYHLGIYFLNRQKKSFLWFALLVFFIFLRQLLLSEIPFTGTISPIYTITYLKIAIASAFLSSLMVFWLFKSAYPRVLSSKTVNIYSVIILGFTGFVFIFPMYNVSVGAHWFQFILVAAMAYIFYLGIRSFSSNKNKLVAVGIMLLLLSVIFEVLIFNRLIYSSYILHYGIITFVLLESYALASAFSESHKKNLKLAEELKYKNRNLEKLVVQKTKEIVDAKERELFSMLLEKAKSDRLLKKVQSGLRSLDLKNAGDIHHVNNIVKTIHTTTELDETNNHLLHFRKIHPHYIESLQTKHPDLSPNEVKLCTYLKLNLNYKGIADILHVRPESVRKAKSRMRQKMGLNSDRDLRSYLNNI
jgi:DNA-binding CsgD family transcriptional regulator